MILKNGVEVSRVEIEGWLVERRSAEWIADQLGVSRMGLWKIRRRLGIGGRKGRSDKGKRRVERTEVEERELRRGYQRKFRKRHPERVGRRGYEVREIFYKLVGRYPNGEVVHHIDSNPRNNLSSNLVICDQSYHMGMFHSPVSNPSGFAFTRSRTSSLVMKERYRGGEINRGEYYSLENIKRRML